MKEGSDKAVLNVGGNKDGCVCLFDNNIIGPSTPQPHSSWQRRKCGSAVAVSDMAGNVVNGQSKV